MAAVTTINNLGACAHNPRGNLWFNDESTYGHKLLMKMGWSKGKGLGKNEDGIKENLSVKFKNTNSGLGYKDDSYANVMKTEYESILKNLSANYSQDRNGAVKKDIDAQENKSCEQNSRIVKSRLRYPKLFFGKDVTKYSEKDMKSIFICSLPSKDNEKILEDSNLSQKQKPESEFPSVVETHCSTLSISEYFAKKMKEKKGNILTEEANGAGQQQSSLKSKTTKTDILCRTSSKKRHKNSEVNVNQESITDSDLQQTTLDFEVARSTENLTTRKKSSSRKKRKKSKISISEVETASPHTNDIEHECTVPNKKKQKLSEDLVCGDNVSELKIYEIGKIVNNNSCIPDKKKRKSKVYENENNSVDIITHNKNKDKISCHIKLSSATALQLKKKQKKHNKKMILSTDTGELSVENSQIMDDHPFSRCAEEGLSSNDVCSKKKKKLNKMKLKKLKSCLKGKSRNYSIKNVSFNENVSYRLIDTDYESVEYLSDACSIVQNSLTAEIADAIERDESKSDNCLSVAQEITSDDNKCNSESSAEVAEAVLDEELKESCSLSSLPSSKSSHYNCWIESQRQALKMKIYKNMLKSIKKHKILKTSNLLSIKGYGNWGFK